MAIINEKNFNGTLTPDTSYNFWFYGEYVCDMLPPMLRYKIQYLHYLW